MKGELRKKLLEREMTRKEFLQFSGSFILVLFGFTNLLALLNRFSKSPDPTPQVSAQETRHGFGSRKFGA